MLLKYVLRYIVHIITVTCGVIGAAVSILGYLNLITHAHYAKVTHLFYTFGITLIVVGMIIIIVSLTGLVGNVLRNKCISITYTVLLILVLLAQILALIVGYSFFNEESLRGDFKSSLQFYKDGKDIKKFWDLINTKLECCGVTSVNDWGKNIPNSCCTELDMNDICHKELANQKPCLPKLLKFLRKKIPIGLIIISSVQILGIIIVYSSSRLWHKKPVKQEEDF